VSSPTEQPSLNELRVVIDAQIVLSMFLIRRDRPDLLLSPRTPLRLIEKPLFRWLWTPEIISDYEQGSHAIAADERLTRRYVFDIRNFQILLAALQFSPSAKVSASTLRRARQRMAQAPRGSERDLDDAIYLACAVDGNAHLLSSEDSDLRMLGRTYEGVRIVSWTEMKEELHKRGLWS